jgi:hypothetical protein
VSYYDNEENSFVPKKGGKESKLIHIRRNFPVGMGETTTESGFSYIDPPLSMMRFYQNMNSCR